MRHHSTAVFIKTIAWIYVNVKSKISPQYVTVHFFGRSYRLTSQMKAQLLNNGREPNPTLIRTNQNSYLSHWPSFSFFQFGEWVDIHVDRRLPANRASDASKLLYSKRSKKDLDWWCPLLEKAYAKENFTQLHVFSVCNGIFHEFLTHRPLMQYPIMLESSTFDLIYFKICEFEPFWIFNFSSNSVLVLKFKISFTGDMIWLLVVIRIMFYVTLPVVSEFILVQWTNLS